MVSVVAARDVLCIIDVAVCLRGTIVLAVCGRAEMPRLDCLIVLLGAGRVIGCDCADLGIAMRAEVLFVGSCGWRDNVLCVGRLGEFISRTAALDIPIPQVNVMIRKKIFLIPVCLCILSKYLYIDKKRKNKNANQLICVLNRCVVAFNKCYATFV